MCNLSKGQHSKRYTLFPVSAVREPFYISNTIYKVDFSKRFFMNVENWCVIFWIIFDEMLGWTKKPESIQSHLNFQGYTIQYYVASVYKL